MELMKDSSGSLKVEVDIEADLLILNYRRKIIHYSILYRKSIENTMFFALK